MPGLHIPALLPGIILGPLAAGSVSATVTSGVTWLVFPQVKPQGADHGRQLEDAHSPSGLPSAHVH
jgi:hypothetical protein